MFQEHRVPNPVRFIYMIGFTTTGATEATPVTTGMQIPLRTDFVSTSNGQINVLSGGASTPAGSGYLACTRNRVAIKRHRCHKRATKCSAA